MALSEATITLDLHQALGADFDTRRTKINVYTNVENHTLIDTSTGETRLGDQTVPIDDDGTAEFTTWTPGPDGNPVTWQTYIAVSYPRTGARDRQVRTFGPYTITEDADLADLEEEQAVPAEYLTAVTAALDAIRDDAQDSADSAAGSATAASGSATSAATSATNAAASAALAHDISGIATPDGVVEALIHDPASDTTAALSDAYVERSNAAPSKVFYGGSPLDPDNGTTRVALVDGSATTPNANTDYAHPLVYLERHTNNSTVAQSNNWGNAYRSATQLIETVVGPDEIGEINGLAIRVTGTSANPITGAGLVGISTLAQNDPDDPLDRGRDMWGANLACVQLTGYAANNMVGIEVDLVPHVPMQWTARPTDPSVPAGEYNNWSGFVAASAGLYPSNSAFVAMTSDGTPGNTTPGWYRGFLAECDFLDYAAFLRNTKDDDADARGLYVETNYVGSTGRVIEAFVGTTEQFRVDGGAMNPVWVRRDGTLKNMSQFVLQDSGALSAGEIFSFGKFAMTGDTDVVRFRSKGSVGGYIIYGADQTTGTHGQIRFMDNAADSNARAVIQTAEPASGQTTLMLAYHNGTSVQALSTVTVGAADSGGSGFRVLRVPN